MNMARTRVFSAAYAEDASVYETLIAAFLPFARNAASGTIRDALRVGTWPQTANRNQQRSYPDKYYRIAGRHATP
jgi:hypothetical protein